MAEIVLEDVSVRFGRRVAVAGFDATVSSGSWLGLIGPNGAGKSSLLRALVGLVRSKGTITIDGVSLADVSPRERARMVAYVPQDPLVPADMPVQDYVLLGRTPYLGYLGVASSSDRAVVDEALKRLDLVDFGARMMGELSGGERQRVVLARALAQEAPVLVLDEPTSALDIGHQQQALEMVTELRTRRHVTVIAAMHDLTLAATYADSLTMLDAGREVASGDARDVLTAERLGEVFHVCVSVDYDEEDDTVIVVPRRGFPVDPQP